MTPRRSRVAGDGVDLAVWERGDASNPTVVLVHGYPDSHVVWDGVAEALSPDHHVVAYDVRGAGESGAPATAEGYRAEHLVADLAAVIDATSPAHAVHLVGHDWGSIQSWEAVLSDRLAGRIASYTSISGPPLGHVARWVRERRAHGVPGLRQLLRQGARSWYIAFFQIPGVPDVAWRRFYPRAFRQYLQRVEGFPAGVGPAPTLARDGENGLELYRQNVGRHRSAGHRTTDVPVLLVVLTLDRFVTPALLDGLEQTAPHLTRHELDGQHWAVVTRADDIAAAVRRHVAVSGPG